MNSNITLYTSQRSTYFYFVCISDGHAPKLDTPQESKTTLNSPLSPLGDVVDGAATSESTVTLKQGLAEPVTKNKSQSSVSSFTENTNNELTTKPPSKPYSKYLSAYSAKPYQKLQVGFIPSAVAPPVVSQTNGSLLNPADDRPMEVVEVELNKGAVGLGFCVEGGKGSPLGDRPITVKRLFKGRKLYLNCIFHLCKCIDLLIPLIDHNKSSVIKENVNHAMPL